MQGLRSRAGIVAMTAGAIALLSVPVVALAKGPPDAVGGGNDTARSVASPQANIPETNPGQAKKPVPVAKRAGSGAGQGSAPAGGSAGGGNVSAPPRRAAKKAKSNGSPPAHAKAYGHSTPPGHAKRSHEPAGGSSDPGPVNQPAPSGSPEKPSGSPNKPSRGDSPEELDPTGPLNLPSADSPESSDGDGGIPAAVVSDTVELSEDASPETLPFTGIQLGLLALIGLTSLVGGFALRRSAT
jgi:hypothetical protein